MSNQKMSVVEKVGFGAGDMALNVVISSMMLIITFFYTDIYGLKTTDLALLFVLVKIVGAMSDLVMGQITDRLLTRWGRYRPYLLLLAVPYGLSVFLVFSTPDWGYSAKLVWAYSTYIMMTIMTSGVGVSYISLPSALTNDPQETLSANGYRLFFAKIGAFMVTVVVPLLAERWGRGNAAAGYQAAMAVMAVMGVVLFLFCFFTTRERVVHKVQRQSLPEQIKVLMKNDQWLILCAVCVTGTIGYVIRGSVAIYYAKYYLHGDAGTVSAFLSTGVAAAILSMMPRPGSPSSTARSSCSATRRSRWRLISVRSTSWSSRATPCWPLCCTSCCRWWWTCMRRCSGRPSPRPSTTARSRPASAYRASPSAASRCARRPAWRIAGALVGVLLGYFEYQPNQEQSAFALHGIALMLTLIPGFFHSLMGLLMFKYRIDDAYYTQVKTQMGVQGHVAV
jgi:GPH family glycoside/pentoside/hexuronide:cation symporter